MTVVEGAGPVLFAMTHSAPGGLREIWNDVSDGLRARGHNVGRFVFYPPDAADGDGGEAKGWHHVVARKPHSALAALRLVLALVRYLRRTRPAAIVTAMPAANVVMPIAVTLARVPTRVFVTHHSPTDTHNPKLDRLDGWTGSLPCVAAVVSVSDAVAATLADKPAAYRAKRCTIHNALPERVEQLLDQLSRTAHEDRPEVRIVALGRLTRQKNYPMLLQAMAGVSGATLEIVGGGEDGAALRALVATLGIADRVKFAGLLPREAALERAAVADIFVQVSLYEGHSLALIEAARLGLPLIVSDVAVQVEGVTAQDGTRCGLVVPLGDAAALADAINRLAADPALRAHWAALASRIAGEASHVRMIERYEKMLALPAAQA